MIDGLDDIRGVGIDENKIVHVLYCVNVITYVFPYRPITYYSGEKAHVTESSRLLRSIPACGKNCSFTLVTVLGLLKLLGNVQ